MDEKHLDNINAFEGLGGSAEKDRAEEEDAQCIDTKIWVWDGDQYQEFQSDFLNQIFPYKLNKKTINSRCQFIFHFLSSSLHYWVELTQSGQSEPQRLDKKDSTVIEQILKEEQCQNWIAYRRWGENFNKQQQFLIKEDAQKDYQVPKGQQMHSYTRGQDEFSIVMYVGNDKQFCQFKKRMEVLLLFYIDGVSFIFEQIDTWIYYIVYKKVKGSQRRIFVGMLSKYVFRLSSVKERHRVSQVFILPSYQKSGHGKELIDLVYDISLKDSHCFEITTEIPSFEYQCLRDFKELQLLVKSNILNLSLMKEMKTIKQIDENRGILLQKDNVRKIKETLKIPGHQIERLVNILTYYQIQRQKDDMVKAHFEQDLKQKIILNRSPFKTRKRLPHLTLYGQVPILKDFMLQKGKEDLLRNQEELLEMLLETVNGFNRVISKAFKTKLLQE